MWLNPELKANLLLSLTYYIDMGRVDKSIIPYLHIINGIDVGVQTIQSCSGHYQGLDGKYSKDGKGYVLFAVNEDFAKRLFANFQFWENIYFFKNVWFYSNYPQAYVIGFVNSEMQMESVKVACVRFEFWSSQYKEAMEKIISILGNIKKQIEDEIYTKYNMDFYNSQKSVVNK